MSYDPIALLKQSGGEKDTQVSLIDVALAFAATSHQGISVDRYLNHIVKITSDVGARHADLLAAGAVDNAQTQLAALKHILSDRENYSGDTEHYDSLQNADLMRVIDRRKGMPIALSILYIHAGRANGWQVDGLNFPGHFLCRIEKDSVRLIFDPFNACEVMEAAALRQLLKKMRGQDAELSPDYYQPCSNREILTRLQNNVKLRLIEAEDYGQALKSVEMMRMMDPGEYRLLLDAGVLYAKTGQRLAAIDVLEKYILAAPDARHRRDAEMLLREIQDTVN